VFVTNMTDAICLLAWFYNQRAGAENLIKEANTWIMHRVRPGAAFDAVRLISYFALFY
jgi:hypothetical protein